MRKNLWLLALAVVLATVSEARADFILDNWASANTTGDNPLINFGAGPSPAPASAFTFSSGNIVFNGNNERDIFLTSPNVTDTTFNSVQVFTVPPAARRLTYTSLPGVSGQADIQYDGNDANAAFNPTGFAPTDVSQGGANSLFTFRSGSDQGATIRFQVFSGAGNMSELAVAIPAGTFAGVSYVFFFSSFVPTIGTGANFSGVTAVRVFIDDNNTANSDATFLAGQVAFAAAPEPASMSLMGLGLVGLVGYGWRKRKQAA